MIIEDISGSKIQYFDLITNEIIHHICDYLDPFSLVKFGRTSKLFDKITSHPLLFKKFCLVLYNSIPPLPNQSPFEDIIHIVNNSSIGEYTQQFKNKVNQDFRSVLWGLNMKIYYSSPTYFKQFGNFRGVYLYAPRVRFVGVYQQKEVYTRPGTKDLDQFYDPVHLIEFYRYFRFYPDGFVIYMNSVKKQNKDQLIKKFNRDGSAEMLTINHILQGEYMVKEDKVYIRLFSPKITIYEIELRIGGSMIGKFDRMQQIDHQLRILGYDASPSMRSKGHQNKLFKFFHIKEFRHTIQNSMIRSITS